MLRRGIRGRFRLVRQSPTQTLRADLGARGPRAYRLAQPLQVKEGDYVGLTAVTWVPAFAVNLDADEQRMAGEPRRSAAAHAVEQQAEALRGVLQPQPTRTSSRAPRRRTVHLPDRAAALLGADRARRGRAAHALSAARLAGARVLLAELLELLRRAAARRRECRSAGCPAGAPGPAARRRSPAGGVVGAVVPPESSVVVLLGRSGRCVYATRWSEEPGRGAQLRDGLGAVRRCRRHRRSWRTTTPTIRPVTTAAMPEQRPRRRMMAQGRRSSAGRRRRQ